MPRATAFRRFLSLVSWGRLPRASRRRGSGRLTPRRCIGLEPLEDRRLLSIEPVSLVDPSMVGDTAGAGDMSASRGTWVSQSGQFVAFTSDAPNLVSGQVDARRGDDFYSNADVFLYDRVAKTTTLVSHASNSYTTTADSNSVAYGISADGRYVLFGSNADNLIAGQHDLNGGFDFFLYDSQDHSIRLVSRSTDSKTTGDGACSEAVLSANGRYVAFTSASAHMISGQDDTNSGADDVFLFDSVAQSVQLVSRAAGSTVKTGDAGSRSPSISDDGQWVAYASDASDLIAPGNSNGVTNVFVYDVAHQTTQLVSHNNIDSTKGGSGSSGAPAISGDGKWIAYESAATDLVSNQSDNNSGGDPADATDVFLYSAAGKTSQLVSNKSGNPSLPSTGNHASQSPVINYDGTYVAFTSLATDLVANQSDSNYDSDVFLFTRTSGSVRLVSHTPVPTPTAGGQGSHSPSISSDGQYVAFASAATDLTSQSEGNSGDDVFVFATGTGALQLASHKSDSTTRTGDNASSQPVISDDGSFVAFVTDATDLVAGKRDADSSSDIVLFDRANSAASYVSLRAADSPPRTGSAESSATPALGQSSVSADGRFVVFTSMAEDLVPGQVSVWLYNVFLYDALTKTVQLVSHNYDTTTPNLTANGSSYAPTISADGRYVAFVSEADDLISGVTSQGANVYLFDRIAGKTTLVSHAFNLGTTGGDAASGSPVISADGRFLAFPSYATNLVGQQSDAPGTSDIFLYDASSKDITLVSASGGSGSTAVGGSYDPVVSADGRFVAFSSTSDHLVPYQVDPPRPQDPYFPDPLVDLDVFLFDRTQSAAAVQLVSHVAGSPATAGDKASTHAVLSADGQIVAFQSQATDLLEQQAGPADSSNVFFFDRTDASQSVHLVSHAPGLSATGANGWSSDPSVSADGRFVAFLSTANNLITGQVNTYSSSQVFLFDRQADAQQGDTSQLVSHTPASAVTTSNNACQPPLVSGDGRYVAYGTRSTDLIGGLFDQNQESLDVIRFDRLAGAGGTNQLVSQSRLAGPMTGDSGSDTPSISADGRSVVFNSTATDLVAGDYNRSADVFLFRAPGLVNHAPTLSPSGPISLGAIGDDITSAANVGAAVDALAASAVYADADGTLPAGIAVIDADNSLGKWQYSIDGGVSWTDFGSLGSNSATLLVADGLGRDRIRFQPSPGYQDSATLDFRAWDGSDGNLSGTTGVAISSTGATAPCSSQSATVSITVDHFNHPPVANDDENYQTLENQPLDVTVPLGVLANDTDPDGNQLTAVYVADSGPAHGTLDLRSDGSFTYTPDPYFHGTDSFQYQASDGNLASAAATVTITVNHVNHAPTVTDHAYPMQEDGQLTVSAQYGLGAGAADVDVGDSLTFAAVAGSGPTHGALTVNPNGSFTYTPYQYYHGTDSFQYRASDGNASSNAATVTITINHVNHAPSVAPLTYSTNEGEPLSVPYQNGLGAGTTDVDGDGLTFAVVADSGPTHGTLSLNSSDGSFTYTPDDQYSGPDSFSYQAYDGNVWSTSAAEVKITVIHVNHAPSVSAHAYATVQGRPLSVSAQNGLSVGATDADSDPLTFALAGSGPAHGTVSINASNGSFIYTPKTGYYGPDSFQFTANDGTVNSTAGTVNFTVLQYDPDPVVPPPISKLTTNSLTLRRSGTNLQLLSGTTYLVNQPIASVHSLTVLGASNKSDTLTVDFSYTLGGAFPAGSIPGGVVFDCSGSVTGTDALVLRGTTGDNMFTVADDGFSLDGSSFRAPGIQKLSLAGLGGNDTYAIADLPIPVAISDTAGTTDTLSFAAATAPVTVTTLSTQPQNVFGTNATLTLTGTIENLVLPASGYDPNPVLYAPTAGTSVNSLLLRMNGSNLQLYSGTTVLFSEPISALNSLKVVGASKKSDTLTVDFNVGGAFPAGSLPGGVIFDSTGGATRTIDTLVLRGTAGDNNFGVLADGFQLDGARFLWSRVTSGVSQTLQLQGLGGMDTYAISALLPFPLTISDTANIDTLDFSAAPAGVNISLASTAAQAIFGSGNTLTLKGTIERLVGTNYADVLRGNTAANQIIWGLGGADTIYGGSAGGVLVGGDDNDLIVGGSRRNVLIGGLGQDTLRAGSAGDLLIGSQTLYDTAPADLLPILAQWNSTASPTVRASNLTNGTGMPTSTVTGKPINLKKGDGVLDDLAVDTLYGGKGADWFLAFDDYFPAALGKGDLT